MSERLTDDYGFLIDLEGQIKKEQTGNYTKDQIESALLKLAAYEQAEQEHRILSDCKKCTNIKNHYNSYPCPACISGIRHIDRLKFDRNSSSIEFGNYFEPAAKEEE